jgi:hypothetical protein
VWLFRGAFAKNGRNLWFCIEQNVVNWMVNVVNCVVILADKKQDTISENLSDLRQLLLFEG